MILIDSDSVAFHCTNQPLKLDYRYAAACSLGAVYLVFREPRGQGYRVSGTRDERSVNPLANGLVLSRRAPDS